MSQKKNISTSPTTPKTPKTLWTKIAMPFAAKTWNIFRDTQSKNVFIVATNHEEYKNIAAHFHARLFFIVHGLSVDKLQNMFVVALPPYLSSVDDLERRKASKIFQKSHELVED